MLTINVFSTQLAILTHQPTKEHLDLFHFLFFRLDKKESMLELNNKLFTQWKKINIYSLKFKFSEVF